MPQIFYSPYSSSDSKEKLKIKTVQNKETTRQIHKQITLSTTDKQNVFSVQISSQHYHNLKKFLKNYFSLLIWPK